MKCPQCSFVCSELRDICPKCLLDLRPHKESLGLTITDPASSYQQLLSTVAGQPRPPASKKKSGVFSKIFGRPEPKPVSKAKQETGIRVLQKAPVETSSSSASPKLFKSEAIHSEPADLFIKLPEDTIPLRNSEDRSSFSSQETISALSDQEPQGELDEITPLSLDDEIETIKPLTTTEGEQETISLEEILVEPTITSLEENLIVATEEVQPLGSSLLEVLAVENTATDLPKSSLDDDPLVASADFSGVEETPSFFDNHEATTPPVERTVAELFGVESKPYFPREFTYSGQLDEPGSFFDTSVPAPNSLTAHTTSKHGVESSFTVTRAAQISPKTEAHFETLPHRSDQSQVEKTAPVSSLHSEEDGAVNHFQNELQSDELNSYLAPTADEGFDSQVLEIASDISLDEAELEVETESSSVISFDNEDLTDSPHAPVYVLDIDLDDVDEESTNAEETLDVSSTTPLQAVEATSATDVVETSYEFSPVVGSTSEAISYVKFREVVEERSTEIESPAEELVTIPPEISAPVKIEAEEQTEESSVVEHEEELSDEDFSFEIPTHVLKQAESTSSLQTYSEEADPIFTEEDTPKQPSHQLVAEDLASQHLLPKSEPLASKRASEPLLSEDLGSSQRIQLLFEATDRELQDSDVFDEISLSFDQLAERERSEMLELYFDLADEAISNPTEERSFDEQVIKSDQRQIESGLTEQAVEVEKEIAIIRREKARAARKEERYSTMSRKRLAKEVPPEPIGWMRRTLCTIVDLSLISLCCLAAVTISHLLSSPDFLASVKMMEVPSLVDIIYICGLFCALLPITTVSYQAAMLTMFEQTFGMMLFRIEVAREDGDLPSVSQLVLRALTFPFSALFLGFLPPFFGRRSLSDHLARTILIHRRELA